MNIDINIVIVNYNVTEDVRRLLKSIYKHSYSIKFRVNVVDNNSTDKSIRNLEKEFPNVHFYYLDKNYGFGTANNYVLKQINSKYHLVLNPDTELVENSLEKLYDFMESHANIGVVGPKIEYSDGRIQYSCLRFQNACYYLAEIFHLLDYYLKYEFKIKKLFSNGEYIQTDFVLGACMMIRSEVLEKVGFFDERYFLFAEEADLCIRIKRTSNYKVVCWEGTAIKHSRSSSTNKDKSLRIKWLFESKLLFIRKHYSWLYGWLLRSLIIGLMVKNILITKIRNKKDKGNYLKVYKYLIGYYLKGTPIINEHTLF